MHLSSKRLSACLVPLFILISLAIIGAPDSYYLKDDQEYIDKTETKKEQEKPESKIPENIAFNIKATRLPDPSDGKCATQITFELRPDYVGEYVLARSDYIIDTAEQMKKAQVVQNVNAAVTNSILDTDCTPGSYYYAVVSKKSIVDNKIVLYRDYNSTTSPVVLYAKETLFRVKKIKAEDAGNMKVRVTWDRVGKTGMLYTVYRSRSVIDSAERLKESQIVKVVPETGEFIDDTIAVTGTYYYAVTAKVMYGREDTVLKRGENYTSGGVSIAIVNRIAVKSIAARLMGGTAVISWDFTGTQGETAYRLVRSETRMKNMNERTGREKEFDVDLTKKSYTDTVLPAGAFYYMIVPRSVVAGDSHELVAGVNITDEPVIIKAIEKKKPVSNDIERILKRTFFKGLYDSAIKELQNLLAGTDNLEVAAKARLFIGRSYIEKGQYRKALDFLILGDVKKYFPKEAEFWTEFALSRVRNY